MTMQNGATPSQPGSSLRPSRVIGPLRRRDDDALGAGQLEDVLDLDRRGLGGEDRRAHEQGDGQDGHPAVIFPEKHAPEDTRINSGTQYSFTNYLNVERVLCPRSNE